MYNANDEPEAETVKPALIQVLRAHVPDAEPDMGGEYPTCSEEKCRSYDGKRCRLTGFRPGGACEPAMEAFGAIIEGVLAEMEKWSR
jgi:hypothetical protein